MFDERSVRWWNRLALAVFFLIIYSPVAALIAELPAAWPAAAELALPAGRRLRLAGSSIALALASTLLAAGISFAAALAAACSAKGGRLRWLMLFMIPVPGYVHALAWSPWVAPLRGWPFLSGYAGWAASLWVQAMALIPLGFWLNLLAAGSLDPALIDAARLQAAPRRVFLRVVLPLALPALAAGAALLFVLSLTDYTVPALYSTPTYALDIFSEFSGNAQPGRALLVSMPLLAAAAALMAAVQAPLRTAAMTLRRAALSRGAAPAAVFAAGRVAAILLLVQAAVVLLALLRAVSPAANLAAAVASSSRELLFSFSLAAGAAALSVPLSLPAARLLRGRTPGLWVAVLLPVALPAPLVGAGLVSLWNRPATGELYTSALMPLLAALARFLPLGAMVMAAFLRRVDPLLEDAARVFGRRRLRVVARVWIPMLAPALLAAAGIVFALTLGEIGATLVVAPPGRATLSMKIYNYLHYGASEMVASLCLLTTAVTMLGGWVIFRAARG